MRRTMCGQCGGHRAEDRRADSRYGRGPGAIPAAIEAENGCTATTWPDQVEQETDCGRFSSPVWAEEPKNLTGFDLEIKTIERKKSIIALGQSLRPD